MKLKEKNPTLYLTLVFLFGFTGFHHFLEKKIIKGLLYFFTFGLFCFGWFYDVISTYQDIKANYRNKLKEEEQKSFEEDMQRYRELVKNAPKAQKQYTYGNRLSAARKNYIVFDLETTGFKPEEHDIIEIALLRYQNDELVDSYCELVNPKRNISSEITKLTGITNEMVIDAKTFEEQKEDILSFIGDDILLGHNVTFDLRFLVHNLQENVENKYIDTLNLSRKYLKDEVKNCKLATLTKHFGLSQNNHRSRADCIATQELYMLIKERIKESKKQKVVIN